MFICCMVDYGIHASIDEMKYIFVSKICFIVLFVQIPELCREVSIENDILGVSLFEKT